MRKSLLLLAAIAVCFAGMTSSNTAYAKSTPSQAQGEQQPSKHIKRHVYDNAKRQVDASYLTKRTSFTKEDVYDFFEKGYSKDNIKELFTMKILSDMDFNDIKDIYEDNEFNLKLSLKDIQIDEETFNKRFNELFPKDDETNHDLVDRTRVPFKKTPLH